jgi:hypothetical protein
MQSNGNSKFGARSGDARREPSESKIGRVEFLIEVCRKVDATIQLAGSTQSRIDVLADAKTNLGALRSRRFLKTMGDLVDIESLDSLDRTITAVKSQLYETLEEARGELHRHGLVLAAGLESVGIDSAGLRQALVSPKSERIQGLYPALRAIRCDLDVAHTKHRLDAGERDAAKDLPPWPIYGKMLNEKRRAARAKSRPLTDKQVTAQRLMGECDGNITEAAARMGCKRQTFMEHLAAGNAKLGKLAVNRPKTERLREDRRGQLSTSEDLRT